MPGTTIEDRAELRRDCGEWITGYTDPKPGRYHDGLKAGQLSQASFILTLMLRSLAERGGYAVPRYHPYQEFFNRSG